MKSGKTKIILSVGGPGKETELQFVANVLCQSCHIIDVEQFWKKLLIIHFNLSPNDSKTLTATFKPVLNGEIYT